MSYCKMWFFRFPIICLVGLVVAAGQPDPVGAGLPEGVTPPDALRLAPPPMAAADSIIAAMVGEINQDSIYAFIEKLTGEAPIEFDYGTRTVPSREAPCEVYQRATDYLRMCFEAYGYTVDIHYVRYPKLHTILVQPGSVSLLAGQYGNILRALDTSAWLRVKCGIDLLENTYYGCDHVTGDTYVVVGADGLIVTSDDGGLSWTPRTTGVTDRLEDAAIVSSGEGWAAGVSGTILRTTDGGASWSAQVSGVSDAFRDISALDASTAVAVGDAGVIVRTTDGGANWVTIPSGTTNQLAGVTFVGLTGWAVGGSGTILKTLNGGLAWTPLTSGTTSNLKDVSFSDANHGWAVGTASEIIRTEDGGLTWTAQTSPMAGLTLRAVYATSASDGWAVGFEAFSGHMMKTADGGTTWIMCDETIHSGMGNIVATRVGTAAPDEEVLLAGHLDSTSPSGCDLAPGADDNGSGIGVIVEAARVMAQNYFERTIKFVCFTLEEDGLLGSEAYAARAEAEGTQIIGVFNLDSVGWNDDYFRLFSDDYSGWFGDIAYQMALTYAPGLTTYHWYCPGCNWSDHYSFWVHGFNAICGIETWVPAPPFHHTVGDTMGNLDFALIANVTKISVSTIATVAGVDTTSAVVEVVDGEVSFYRLSPARPNPFTPATTIRFSAPAESRVKIQVFSPTGQMVRTLLDGSVSAGRHALTWNGIDGNDRRVAPGVYFCRMEAEGYVGTEKVVLMR